MKLFLLKMFISAVRNSVPGETNLQRKGYCQLDSSTGIFFRPYFVRCMGFEKYTFLQNL